MAETFSYEDATAPEKFGFEDAQLEMPAADVIRSAVPGSLEAHHLVPAVRKIGGELAVGEQGDTHPDIIERDNIPATDIDQRGFFGPFGFMDRESAAQALLAPTNLEPGRLHSTDLSEFQQAGGFEGRLAQIAEEEADKPRINLGGPGLIPKAYAAPVRILAGEEAGKVAESAAETLYNAAKSVPEFLTTDAGIMSVLTSMTGLGRLGIEGIFTYDMAKSVLEQAKQANDNWDNMDASQRASAITQAAATLGFIGALAKGGIGTAKGMIRAPETMVMAPPSKPARQTEPTKPIPTPEAPPVEAKPAPAKTAIEDFTAALEEPGFQRAKTEKYDVGMSVKSIDDLEALAKLRDKYSVPEEGPRTPETAMLGMQRAAQGQLPREAIESAISFGSQDELTSVKKLGERPLDWRKNPEVAKWIVDNAERMGWEKNPSLPEVKEFVAKIEAPKAAILTPKEFASRELGVTTPEEISALTEEQAMELARAKYPEGNKRAGEIRGLQRDGIIYGSNLPVEELPKIDALRKSVPYGAKQVYYNAVAEGIRGSNNLPGVRATYDAMVKSGDVKPTAPLTQSDVAEKWIKEQIPKAAKTPLGSRSVDAAHKVVSEWIQKGETPEGPIPKDTMDALMRSLGPTRDLETGEMLHPGDEGWPRTGTILNFLESKNLDRTIEAPAPVAPKTKTARKEPVVTRPENWDVFYEDLTDGLAAFSPARSTGRIDYELEDVAQRFVDFAKSDTSGRPLSKIVNDFADRDVEASTSQIRKIKSVVKELEKSLPVSTPKPVEPAPVAQPELVGMGGATPEEFKPAATTPTGIKNAVVDQERAKRGLPPAVQPIRRAFGEVWDRAMALIDRDPGIQDRLISELKAKPRALTDTEDAMLLHRQVDLQNEYGKATRDLAQAYADGRTESVDAERARVASLSDALLDIYNIGKTSGTETGRGLNARKMMANEDFTLASMEMQKRAAVGGRPLTDTERAEITELNKKIETTQKAYDDYVKANESRIAKMEVDLALARTAAEAKAEPKYHPKVIQVAEKFASYMDKKASDALSRLQARRQQTRMTSGGLDPADLDDLAIIGAAKLTRGAVELAKWSDAMVKDIGDWVKPHLQAAWDASQKIFAAETDRLEKSEGKALATAVKKKAAQPSAADQIKGLGEQVRQRQQKGQLDKINWLVRKMARVFYQEGITEREAMVDALHAELSKIMPDWTRRQTQDAFSGYGDFKPLNKDAITVALRGMKGELQQLAKLEDMAAGKPPLKSGLERRTPTEAERQLIKRVNDAKYKFQVPVADPNTQLKSALDTLKTTLKNRITDYEDRLYRRDFSTRPRRKVELDREATRLKSESERAKDKFRAALAADRLKNRTNWEKALDWGTKYRRFGVLSSIRVLPKLISAGLQRLASMPIEELVGAGARKIPGIKGIAERAPLEGSGTNWTAEASGFAKAFTQGMKDAYDVLKTGRSELDVLYGKSTDNYVGEAEFGSKLLSLPGRIHGMLKAPVKRAAFERAVQRLGDYYARQGLDVTDDLVKVRIAVEAYKAGSSAIFLGNNFVADKVNAFLSTKIDPTTGHPTPGSKVWTTLGRVALPIVRVPTNIVAETMQYTGGLISAPIRIVNALRKGVETLPPEQADLIMRELKKGAVGGAVMALGYFNADKIGGYYQPGKKRPKEDVKPGSIRVFGVDIPSWLLHNPLLETLQVGATVRRVADSKLRKKDEGPQGLPAGIGAAAFGVIEQVPFVREMSELEKLRNPYTRGTFMGEQAKSILVPSAVQQAAEWTDPLAPKVKRKPTTVVQHVKTGIPGLRQQVPTQRVKQ